MPLRKKHVRRIVAAAVLLVVLAPLAALALYALSLRGDLYGRGVAKELASRLRCEADIRGARPTGPSSAAADGVDLTWDTGIGQVIFRLKNVTATRTAAGWQVLADQGRLEVQTQNLRETLEVWNQRMVQPAGADTALTVRVESFTVALATDVAACEERGVFEFGLGVATPLRARFHGENSAAGAKPGRFSLSVHLDPRSGAGVFQVLNAHMEGVPANRLARFLLGREAPTVTAGTARIEMQWARAGWQSPGPSADLPRHITVAAKGLDLAEWTPAIPGGPVRATADFGLDFTEADRGDDQLTVAVTAMDGAIGPETLRWLEELPMGLAAVHLPGHQAIAFDRLAVRCLVAGGRGRFETDHPMQTELISGHLMGARVPLLVAPARPFDAAALWAELAKALTAEPPAAGQ
jgi:hypothetical protein